MGTDLKPSEFSARLRLPQKKEEDAHRRSRSIKWKIYAYLVLFTAIILLLLWLCQVVFLDDIYKTIKIGEIHLAAHELTAKIDSDNFAEEAETCARRGELCLLVLKMIDENTAAELVSVETLPNCAIHNTDRNSKFTLYDLARANGGELIRRYRFDPAKRVYYTVEDDLYKSAPDSEESIIYTLITQNSAGDSILLLLNSVISPVEATVKTLNILLAVISALLLLLALALATVISRRIARPIVRINETAKQLAVGKYDVNFPSSSYREIDELAGTLNYAASELSKVETLRRELIANISHDLRTPLTMIEGYGEVMRDLPGENTPENVQIIIDEANRLSSLVSDMLDLSRLHAGAVEFRPVPLNLTELIRSTLTRYNKLCASDGYVIDFLCDRDVTVSGDATRLNQVIYNLVNNAVTYTGADKRVTVEQTIHDGRVRISVTDTGEGIPPEKLEMIWDRYYKGENAHRRPSVGTGIGLSIVKSIMELHHGTYGVASTEGVGSTFWVEMDVYSGE